MNTLIRFTLILLVFPALVFGQEDPNSLDRAFANPTTLTDQQMDDAQNFEHSGIRERSIEKNCSENKEALGCVVSDGLPIESMIGKIYSTFGLIGGAKLKGKVTTPASEGQAEVRKEITDVCMYTAMIYETVGGQIQQGLNANVEAESASIPDLQLRALVSAKEGHSARAKTAKWQGLLYGSVTACYMAMPAFGAVVDWKYGLKLAGAMALTGLYWNKFNKHKKAREAIQTVIDSLPKAGDCNPWTGTSCFCSERTSQERYPSQYQEVCVLNKGNFETPRVAVGCGALVNGQVQYDKECQCKQNNSCVKSGLRPINGNFPFATNLLNQANKNLDLLNSGEFDQGRIDEASTSTAALTGKVKPNFKAKYPSPKLSPEQQKVADALGSVLPAPVAAIAAASNNPYRGGIPESSSTSAGLSKLSPELKEKLATAIKANYKSAGGGSNRGSFSDEPEFNFPKLPGQEKAVAGTEVISFAEQAISQADVSNAPTTPIFDIISNRYRRSGWKKLESAANE